MQILNHSGTVQGHLFTDENQHLATFSTVEYAQLFINWAATVKEAEWRFHLEHFNAPLTKQELEAFHEAEKRWWSLMEKGVTCNWQPDPEAFVRVIPRTSLCCQLY